MRGCSQVKTELEKRVERVDFCFFLQNQHVVFSVLLHTLEKFVSVRESLRAYEGVLSSGVAS